MKSVLEQLLRARVTRPAPQPTTLLSDRAALTAAAERAGPFTLAPQRAAAPLAPAAGFAFSFSPATSLAVDAGGRTNSVDTLLRPTFTAAGVAGFRPFDDVERLARAGNPPPPGLLLVDTNLGPLEDTVPGWRAATVDHHGPVHGGGSSENTTQKLLRRFEGALTAAADATTRAPATFDAAAAAVARAFATCEIPQGAPSPASVAAALRALNLRELSSDNVGDGLSWPYWMARHQVSVLADPALRRTIHEATQFEDFTVFSGTYLNDITSLDALPAAVRLQCALFVAYDDALRAVGITSTDRVPARCAQAVAEQVSHAIDALLADPAAVEHGCDAFFSQVGLALATLEEQAIRADLSIKDADGGFVFVAVDMAKLPSALGTFARWATIPLFAPDAVRLTVAPLPDPGRTITIVGISAAGFVPGDQGLLPLIAKLNARERAQTPEGQPVATWFGRETVVLPSLPGTVLDAATVRDLVVEAGLLPRA